MKNISFPANRAFTLLEIMLVVAIITLLLSTGFYMIGGKFAYGQDVKVQADITSISQNLKTYEMMNNFLPSNEQGLQALVTQPQSDPKPTHWYNMMEHLPQDPWGHDYVYINPGKHNPQGFDLYSKGKDGVDGTADDRGNWDTGK